MLKTSRSSSHKACNNTKVIQVCNNLDKFNAQNQSIIIAQSMENILVNNDLSLTTNIVKKSVTQEQPNISNQNNLSDTSGQTNPKQTLKY